ncbi:MAG: hypothetical protein ABIH21_04200 [Patescibacteria group bacterium]
MTDIRYLGGSDLCAVPGWEQQVSAQTMIERDLLFKTPAQLLDAAQNHFVVIAVDHSADNKVVGCIIRWHLFNGWYELGTFYVVEEYRFRHNLSAEDQPRIGDILYGYILKNSEDKNILGTTTNLSAIKTGERNGMVLLNFDQLPDNVRCATCICPAEKTLSKAPTFCWIKDGVCRVRVSAHTWVRMGRPMPKLYSMPDHRFLDVAGCGCDK